MLKKLIIIFILSSSIMANDDVTNWSLQAAKKLIEFSYQDNPKTYWLNYRNLFSEHGWIEFSKALKQTHNAQTIVDLKLITHLKIDRANVAIMKNKDQTNILIPATITYAGYNIASFFPATISITIKRNKIETFTVKQLSQAKSKAIYPRGCHLRQYN